METIGRILFLLSKGRILHGRIYIYVPDYFDWNYKHIYNTITEKMGWKSMADRDEHFDCRAEPIVHYFVRGMRVQGLTPNTLRYSAIIRIGQMSRNEALRIVEKERTEESVPHETGYFLDKLGINENDLRNYMLDGRRHMKYQNQNLLRKAYHILQRTGITK